MSNYNCLNTNCITESFHSHRHQGRKKQTNQQGTVPKQMAKRAHASLQSPPLNSGCVRFRLLLQRDQQAALKHLIQHQKCISKKESRRHLKKKKSPHEWSKRFVSTTCHSVNALSTIPELETLHRPGEATRSSRKAPAQYANHC